jgi:hypothetical protein
VKIRGLDSISKRYWGYITFSWGTLGCRCMNLRRNLGRTLAFSDESSYIEMSEFEKLNHWWNPLRYPFIIFCSFWEKKILRYLYPTFVHLRAAILSDMNYFIKVTTASHALLDLIYKVRSTVECTYSKGMKASEKFTVMFLKIITCFIFGCGLSKSWWLTLHSHVFIGWIFYWNFQNENSVKLFWYCIRISSLALSKFQTSFSKLTKCLCFHLVNYLMFPTSMALCAYSK